MEHETPLPRIAAGSLIVTKLGETLTILPGYMISAANSLLLSPDTRLDEPYFLCAQ
jgi:hypothetical protein